MEDPSSVQSSTWTRIVRSYVCHGHLQTADVCQDYNLFFRRSSPDQATKQEQRTNPSAALVVGVLRDGQVDKSDRRRKWNR